mgnify:CR=1 FL=1
MIFADTGSLTDLLGSATQLLCNRGANPNGNQKRSAAAALTGCYRALLLSGADAMAWHIAAGALTALLAVPSGVSPRDALVAGGRQLAHQRQKSAPSIPLRRMSTKERRASELPGIPPAMKPTFPAMLSPKEPVEGDRFGKSGVACVVDVSSESGIVINGAAGHCLTLAFADIRCCTLHEKRKRVDIAMRNNAGGATVYLTGLSRYDIQGLAAVIRIRTADCAR